MGTCCSKHSAPMTSSGSATTNPLASLFDKRGVKLALFQRLRDACLKRDVAASEKKCREAAEGGCERYVVVSPHGVNIRSAPSLSSNLVRVVPVGGFVDVLPGSTILGIDEDEYEGTVRVHLVDGSGWTTLTTFDGQAYLQLVGPVPIGASLIPPGHWTVSRVSALVIGNHEILKAGNRWEEDQGGKEIDPSSTLTHAGQCSLIEAIRQGRFEAHDAPLGGNLRYDDVVGAKSDIFVSFAYSCDFIELVDALECFFDQTPSLDKSSTYLWFDLFVNDQWRALDKPFEWWASTFKEAVEEIGHTVVVMLPWEAPIPLTRVWCLFEIACSKKLSIALSSAHLITFNQALRYGRTDSITDALCNINVEEAFSFVPEDKEMIFAVVAAKHRGGFDGLNSDVSRSMRRWIEAAAKDVAKLDAARRKAERERERRRDGVGNGCGKDDEEEEKEEEDDDLEAIDNLENLGNIYVAQGKFEEAMKAWKRVLRGFERLKGAEHASTLATIGNLSILLKVQNRHVEAKNMLGRALQGKEQTLGIEYPSTLITMHNLGLFFEEHGKLDEADELFRRALAGRRRVHGPKHDSTRSTRGHLLAVQQQIQQYRSSESSLSETRRLEGGGGEAAGGGKGERGFIGEQHQQQQQLQAVVVAAAAEDQEEEEVDLEALVKLYKFGEVYFSQGKFDEATRAWKRVLRGRERVLGPEHVDTLAVTSSLAGVYKEQNLLVEAQSMYERAMQLQERKFGADYQDTLRTMNELGNVLRLQSRLDEAEDVLSRCLAGREKIYGAGHACTKTTTRILSLVVLKKKTQLQTQTQVSV